MKSLLGIIRSGAIKSVKNDEIIFEDGTTWELSNCSCGEVIDVVPYVNEWNGMNLFLEEITGYLYSEKFFEKV